MNATEQIIFWADIIPKEWEKEVSACSKKNMVDAANALEWNLLKGLENNTKKSIIVINTLPVGSYPQYYSKPFIQRSLFMISSQLNIAELGFCNIKLIRKISIANALYRETCKILKKNSKATTIYIYSASSIYLNVFRKIKRRFPNVKSCMIIADLPGMTNLSRKKPISLRLYEKFTLGKTWNDLTLLDCFVFLTKYMRDYLKIDRPYCVMEGIASESPKANIGEKRKKTILYTGTLHQKFGVMNLVKAFGQIENPNYRLVICGIGDSEKAIQEAAEKDSRISFLGQLPRKEVLEWQSKATVLVNPRQNNEEFTKYSFPSKTMEYLSSGIPVVAYKLDGIPDEYDAYIQYVEDDSIESLKKKLIEVCELSDEERKNLGSAGRAFVLTEKNSTIQVKKIVELIDSL